MVTRAQQQRGQELHGWGVSHLEDDVAFLECLALPTPQARQRRSNARARGGTRTHSPPQDAPSKPGLL